MATALSMTITGNPYAISRNEFLYSTANKKDNRYPAISNPVEQKLDKN